MPPRNAEATRARILEAAVAEFAAHGFAGGRVDRLAKEAGSNVRMIYAYFGGKDALFDAALAAALTAALTAMTAAVPPDPDDLPGWAGRVFDFHGANPAPLRISLWAQLERPEAAAEPLTTFLAKTAGLTGLARPPLGPVDLLTLVYAITQAWYLTPHGLLAADGADPRDPARIAAHRAAVVATVSRLVETPVTS